MDIGNLAELGVKIAEVGSQLRSKREHKAELDSQIKELEGQLFPLLSQHAKLIAEIAGESHVPLLAAVQAPAAPNAPRGFTPPDPSEVKAPIFSSPNQTNMTAAEQKIRRYLESHKDEDPRDIFPMRISEDLKIDYAVCRTLMAKILPTLMREEDVRPDDDD